MFAETLRQCYEINLNDYENIGINLPINKVLIPAFFVFVLFTVALSLYRMSTRRMISQLLRHSALSEDSAKSLASLGLGNDRLVKYLLRRDNLLTRVVGRRGENKYTYEEYIVLTKEERRENDAVDFETAEFYISEDMLDRARTIVDKYNYTLGRTVMVCVFVLLIFVCLTALMPEILSLVNNLLK